MIVFSFSSLSSLPSKGDTVKFDGRDYQLTEQPVKDTDLQRQPYRATARFTYTFGCIEKIFYFTVDA